MEQSVQEIGFTEVPATNNTGLESSKSGLVRETPAAYNQTPAMITSNVATKKRNWEEHGSVDDESVASWDSDHQHYRRHRDKKSKNIGNMKTLRQLAEQGLIKVLEKAVTGRQPNALYCCGGSAKSAKLFSMITLRWDCPGEDNISRKIQFPVYKSNREAFQADIGRFFETAKVLNGNGTLNKTQFSVNVDPYSQGIIDVLSKSFLPANRKLLQNTVPDNFSIRTELSNLHVRIGGGQTMNLPVKANRPNNIGKLIMCLPCSHQGGELKVSHGGHRTTFDWSKSLTYPLGIQWAAFFKDCEHELQPVLDGYQILLDYDVYLEDRKHMLLTGTSWPIDATVFPLYEGVRTTLELPFMKEGGTLGFHCSGSYSHIITGNADNLHHELMGIDKVVYSVFKSLGLTVSLKPFLDFSPIKDKERSQYDLFIDIWTNGGYEDVSCYSECDCGCCFPQPPSFETWKARIPKFDAIGTKFHPFTMSDTGFDEIYDMDEKRDTLQMQWNFDKRTDITWLNKFSDLDKSWQTLAIVNLQHYEDDVSDAELYYSHVVILITIPKIFERSIKNVLFSALGKRL